MTNGFCVSVERKISNLQSNMPAADVTEFKYYIGQEKHKAYLSAIPDLYDRRIVSYVIGDNNNNALVFDTFEQAIADNPDAHPLCHSDRGFQYTNRILAA